MAVKRNKQAPEAPLHDQPRGRAALLIVDMINPFDFEEGDAVLPRAEAAAGAIRALREQAVAADCPVIYVNDNFGEWHSQRERLVERASGNPVARSLAPRHDDFFVIKPQFSGFYATNLPVLLPKLGVDRLILTGIATEICILFTAADAHMRDYRLWVPRDAVAAINPVHGKAALAIMRVAMGAQTAGTDRLSLEHWRKESGDTARSMRPVSKPTARDRA